MTAQIMIRIDDELKDKTARLARAEGISISELVRSLLTKYSRERDMSAYTAELWRRIGAQLDPRAQDPAYLDEVIRQVRADHRQNDQ